MSKLVLTIPELLKEPTLSIQWHGNIGPLPENVAAISTDTRTIGTGQVFLAIVGEVHDGHDYVEKAFENGALACLVNQSWFDKEGGRYSDNNFLVVPDTLVAYQEIARYYRLKFDIPVIALTGSSGKTTTKEYITSVLSQKYNVLSNIKSFNNHIGVPATLLNLRPEHEILITELGTNGFGELERLSYLVNPSVCVYTNIGFAHLGHFKNVEGVTRAKLEMLSGLQEKGKVIYNADDEILAGLTYSVNKLYSYGTCEIADLVGSDLDCDDNACYQFRMNDIEIKLALPGRHNVSNALAAAAVGKEFDLSDTQIKAGLQECDYVEKRMHVVKTGNIRVIDDSYNANPGSCRAALDTLCDMVPEGNGRRIAVLGDMLELGEYSKQEHVNVIRYALQNEICSLFLFGNEMAGAAQDITPIDGQVISHFNDIESLKENLAKYIFDNDLVLVKGSRSMKMERVTEYLKTIKE